MTLFSDRPHALTLFWDEADNRDTLRQALKDWLHHPAPTFRIAQLRGAHGGGKTHFMRHCLGLPCVGQPEGEGLLELGTRPLFYVDLSRFANVAELKAHLWEMAFWKSWESESFGSQMQVQSYVRQELGSAINLPCMERAQRARNDLDQAFIVFDQLDQCRLEHSAGFLGLLESLVQDTHAQVLLVGKLPASSFGDTAGQIRKGDWTDFAARHFHRNWELIGLFPDLLQAWTCLGLGEHADTLFAQEPELLTKVLQLLSVYEDKPQVEGGAIRPLNGHVCRQVLLKAGEGWALRAAWKVKPFTFLELVKIHLRLVVKADEGFGTEDQPYAIFAEDIPEEQLVALGRTKTEMLQV